MSKSDQLDQNIRWTTELMEMSPDQLLKQGPEHYDQLKSVIRFHEHRYYILNDPLISDYEYDQLYKKLEFLEEKHPEWISRDSPTQRVSTDLTQAFETVDHLKPMLSLANSYDEKDLLDFDKQVKKLAQLPATDKVTYCVEPKYDGGSISLVYENDQLVRAATRGNGFQGELITANARTIKTIPLKVPFKKDGIARAELRGEALIRKDTFRKINKQREEEGLVLFANPRNAATGGLRTKDASETAKRGIEAVIYQVGYLEDEKGREINPYKDHAGGIHALAAMGFKVPKVEFKVCHGIHEVIEFCHAWQERRDDFYFEIDGMVVKVNDLGLQASLGYTSHHPRWAIAFKFKAKQATSRLIGVEYQVGKVGTITPVAKLEPVQVGGVTVSSVSLHNEDFINAKDLHIGDMVIVERSGDVIPYIVKALPEYRKGYEKKIKFPVYCPIGAEFHVKLVREPGQAFWICPDCKCGAQNLEKYIFHVSKAAMDIEGFGPSIMEKFVQLGWIKSLADIYRLDFEQIEKLEGFGEKSAGKLKSAIEKAKSNPIQRLLHSLSIHHLGKKASSLIAERVGYVPDLANWTENDFTNIPEIGPVVTKNVMDWFGNPKNLEVLKEMEALGVNMYQTREDKPKKVDAHAPLAGKTILFTGSLSQLSREEAEKKAEDAGARNLSGVSSKLNILVVGENAGSKLEKARSLGTVEIWTEDEFIQKVAET
ncbi:MAG TPA: NAD-dependent DNA ligase LigA [Saprospiraceae bacterium]|nr:NAD-dependent DNA ligase LigA [Saprospiraceae bacterium]HNT21483.1 NAD-dependent DNA ligase LigA [Saprospiraceae bacterium]